MHEICNYQHYNLKHQRNGLIIPGKMPELVIAALVLQPLTYPDISPCTTLIQITYLQKYNCPPILPPFYIQANAYIHLDMCLKS